jgi:dipeptidyl aminopeptidase/acylaminoacyl peptidase
MTQKTAQDAASPDFDLRAGNADVIPCKVSHRYSSRVLEPRDSFFYDIQSGKHTRTTTGRNISSFSTSADGAKWAFTADSADRPSEVWVSDAMAGSVSAITETNPQVRDLALGETELTTWKSTDGLEVEGILLKPVNFDPAKKYPLMVVVHGGQPAHVNSLVCLRRRRRSGPARLAVLYPNCHAREHPLISGGDTAIIRSTRSSSAALRSDVCGAGWSYGGYDVLIVSQTDRRPR